MDQLQKLQAKAVINQNNILASKNWKVGQKLNAQVIDRSSNALVLRIGNQQLEVVSNLAVQRGASLQLEITGIQPNLQLAIKEVINPKTAASLAGQTSDFNLKLSQLTAAGKAVLTDPTSYLRVLLGIDASARQIAFFKGHLDQISGNAKAIQSLFDADGVRKAIQTSGIFFEPSLLGGKRQQRGPADMKSALLNFLAALSGYSKPHSSDDIEAQQMQSIVEALLARINSNQLASARAAEAGLFEYQTDVPIWIKGSLEFVSLRIRQDKDNQGACKDLESLNSWRIDLRSPIPERGVLDTQIFVSDLKLSAVLKSDSPEFVKEIQEKLP